MAIYIPSGGAVDVSTGWMTVTDSWSYASASTITVPSGAASMYVPGDRIKCTNSGTKYFTIAAVADTLLTVMVNNDYVVANAAISAISFSHQANPVGFPSKFSFSPTYTGFSANPTDTVTYYTIGRTCYYNIWGSGAAGTSNATTFTMSLPVAAASTGHWVALGYGINNGATTAATSAVIVASATVVDFYVTSTFTAWASSNGKQMSVNIIYQF